MHWVLKYGILQPTMKHKLLLLFFCVQLALPGVAYAAAASAEPVFNPNFLISDEELQSQSMTRADIQAFLEDKGSFLATYKAVDEKGVLRTASDIIYQAAKEHDINPKYLLVKLQKEQSLITAKNPTQKQLDGATGYGITDGCGWDCDTYKNNKGFGPQVDAAAGIMRWYYDNFEQQRFIRRPGTTYVISGQEVTPVNKATAFLYTYTPHVLGNKNFWLIWNDWFEQVYPSGTLLKAADDSSVYLIQNGLKRKIENMSALVTRFDPNLIVTVPSSELARYDIGAPISFPNYSILQQGSKYYLLDFDTLRPFKSEAVFREYGYNPQEVIEVTRADIKGYNIGDILDSPGENPRGRVIRAKENNLLYYIKGDSYYPIFDDKIAALALPGLTPEAGSVSELQDYTEQDPLLFPDGTILGIEGSNKVYVIENGKKRHIFDEKVFIGLGYKWENIIWSNQLMSIAHETGVPLYLREETPVPKQNNSIEATTPEREFEESIEPGEQVQSIESLMVRAEKTETIGPVFETDVDTYLIAEYDTGKILAGKNIDQQRPMASFTKVLTAMALFEKDINERKILEFNRSAHTSLYHRFRIAQGEMVRTSDLLDAFLVSSLNTPGRMLAQSVDTEANVIKVMNDLAQDAGATDTKAVDVSGVKVENTTTARDYQKVFSKAIANEKILEYLSKKSYRYNEILDKDGAPTHFDTHSNRLATDSSLSFTIIASKTGYLYESGANLAMLVQRPSDGKQFIIITMGNVDHANRFNEPKKLTEWALSRF